MIVDVLEAPGVRGLLVNDGGHDVAAAELEREAGHVGVGVAAVDEWRDAAEALPTGYPVPHHDHGVGLVVRRSLADHDDPEVQDVLPGGLYDGGPVRVGA